MPCKKIAPLVLPSSSFPAVMRNDFIKGHRPEIHSHLSAQPLTSMQLDWRLYNNYCCAPNGGSQTLEHIRIFWGTFSKYKGPGAILFQSAQGSVFSPHPPALERTASRVHALGTGHTAALRLADAHQKHISARALEETSPMLQHHPGPRRKQTPRDPHLQAAATDGLR